MPQAARLVHMICPALRIGAAIWSPPSEAVRQTRAGKDIALVPARTPGHWLTSALGSTMVIGRGKTVRKNAARA